MRFNHITLDVGDFERSKHFYRTLGLIQIVDTPPRYARFVFPEGDAWLRDPDGHELGLYFAGVNRLDPPWKLKSPAVG